MYMWHVFGSSSKRREDYKEFQAFVDAAMPDALAVAREGHQPCAQPTACVDELLREPRRRGAAWAHLAHPWAPQQATYNDNSAVSAVRPPFPEWV